MRRHDETRVNSQTTGRVSWPRLLTLSTGVIWDAAPGAWHSPTLRLECLATVLALTLDMLPLHPVMIHTGVVPVVSHIINEGLLTLHLLIDLVHASWVRNNLQQDDEVCLSHHDDYHLACWALDPDPGSLVTGADDTVLTQVTRLSSTGAGHPHVRVRHSISTPVTHTSDLSRLGNYSLIIIIFFINNTTNTSFIIKRQLRIYCSLNISLSVYEARCWSLPVSSCWPWLID